MIFLEHHRRSPERLGEVVFHSLHGIFTVQQPILKEFQYQAKIITAIARTGATLKDLRLRSGWSIVRLLRDWGWIALRFNRRLIRFLTTHQ